MINENDRHILKLLVEVLGASLKENKKNKLTFEDFEQFWYFWLKVKWIDWNIGITPRRHILLVWLGTMKKKEKKYWIIYFLIVIN